MKILMDDSMLTRIVNMVIDFQKQENTTLPLLREQLVEAERSIENMLNAIQQGILTSSTKKRLDDLEAAKSDLEIRILQEEIQRPPLTEAKMIFWLHKFRGIDITDQIQRQRLIDTFVNAVYVYDDRIKLIFNYNDDAKTITMAEIEEGFGSDMGVGGASIV